MDNYKFKTYRKLKKINEIIGFTWSPDDTIYSQKDIYILLDNICRDSAYYSYYPEFRDPVNSTGLHYHGKIYIFDKCKWFRRSKPMWELVNKVKPHWEFGLTPAWDQYICKQKGVLFTNHPSDDTGEGTENLF